jgi:hypothetical protein
VEEYRRLRDLEEREERRRRTLAAPIEAARSAEAWQASFDALARVREKAAYLSDDELDALTDEAVAAVRRGTPAAIPYRSLSSLLYTS